MTSHADTRAYFLSDCHLGAHYMDRRRHEALLVRFLESIAGDATELYLLGDILDYWYEYRTVVPRGYIRFFGALARLADAGVKITWLTGNHDIWLFDYLSREIGLTVIDGPLTATIAGHNFYMAHGDRLGSEPSRFKLIQKVFRNKCCQTMFAAVHPRWTVPLGYGWSSKNRGVPHPAKLTPECRQRIVDWANRLLELKPQLDYILLGHYHVKTEIMLHAHCRLEMLGEWIHHSTYGVFDGKNFKLLEFEEKTPDLIFINNNQE